jgi:ATP-binding cassette subfamily B protein
VSDLRLVRRALALVIGAAPLAVAVSLALAALGAAAPVAQVWLSKVIVDRLSGGDAARAVTLAVVYAVALGVPTVVAPLERLLTIGLEEQAVGELDRRLMATGARLVDLHRIERPAFADELRALKDSSHWPPRALHIFTLVLSAPLTFLGVLGLLASLHPLLPVALLAAAVPHARVEGHLRQRLHESMVRQARPAREMEYCTRMVTEPAGAKEVRVFGLGPFFLGRFAERSAAALIEVHALRLGRLRAGVAFAGLHALALAGGFVYVASRASTGALTLGDIALYLSAVAQAASSGHQLSGVWSVAHDVTLGLRVIFPFLDRAAPAIALASPREARHAPVVLERGIELRRLSFAYPASAEPVLDDLSAFIPAGRVTAVVGANGAGKSTLVKLLTRMYDPDGGEILLDGVPVAAFDLGSWRQRIAAVHQDFARLSLTLRDNIGLGADDDGTVEAAARLAGADQLAAKLPGGFDAPLTRRFEGGSELSGGEWQAVALARGFLRSDAALVILDEPTATLDAEAEYRLFRRFAELVTGKTALLISHRFSTVRMADQILVLERGRILQAGSHAELVALGGRYAELYEMQASRYR